MKLADILRIVSTLSLIAIAVSSVRIMQAVEDTDKRVSRIMMCILYGRDSAFDRDCPSEPSISN